MTVEPPRPKGENLILLYARDALTNLANLPEAKRVRVEVLLKSGKSVVVEGTKGATL